MEEEALKEASEVKCPELDSLSCAAGTGFSREGGSRLPNCIAVPCHAAAVPPVCRESVPSPTFRKVWPQNLVGEDKAVLREE